MNTIGIEGYGGGTNDAVIVDACSHSTLIQYIPQDKIPDWAGIILTFDAVAGIIAAVFLFFWFLDRLYENGRITMLSKKDCRDLADAHQALQDTYWAKNLHRQEAKIKTWKTRSEESDRRARK